MVRQDVIGQRQYRMAFFGEDEWKVTPALTLNIGLRYGYDQPLYEVNGKEVNVEIKTRRTAPTACSLLARMVQAMRCTTLSMHSSCPAFRSLTKWIRSRSSAAATAITDDFEGMGSAQRLTANPPFISS